MCENWQACSLATFNFQFKEFPTLAFFLSVKSWLSPTVQKQLNDLCGEEDWANTQFASWQTQFTSFEHAQCWISYKYTGYVIIVFLCHLNQWGWRAAAVHWWTTSLGKCAVPQGLGRLPVECTTASAKTHKTNLMCCYVSVSVCVRVCVLATCWVPKY